MALNQTEASINIRDGLQLTAKISPQNFTEEVNWSSSDESVAAVSERGYVTAVKAATADITVTAVSAGKTTIIAKARYGSGRWGSCEITVEEPAVTGAR